MTKSYVLSEEEIRVLKNLLDHLHLSTEPEMNIRASSYNRFCSPADKLRNQATAMENKDYAVGMFRRLMSRINVETSKDDDGSAWPPFEPTGCRSDSG